jgi:hypothetical protein
MGGGRDSVGTGDGGGPGPSMRESQAIRGLRTLPFAFAGLIATGQV